MGHRGNPSKGELSGTASEGVGVVECKHRLFKEPFKESVSNKEQSTQLNAAGLIIGSLNEIL